jgi:hypothetical protein
MFAKKSKHHRYLRDYEPARVWQAISAYRAALSGDEGETEQPPGLPDLLTPEPEWQALSAAKSADSTTDFALVDASLSGPLSTVFSQVRQVERLREVRASSDSPGWMPQIPRTPAGHRIDLGGANVAGC